MLAYPAPDGREKMDGWLDGQIKIFNYIFNYNYIDYPPPLETNVHLFIPLFVIRIVMLNEDSEQGFIDEDMWWSLKCTLKLNIHSFGSFLGARRRFWLPPQWEEK